MNEDFRPNLGEASESRRISYGHVHYVPRSVRGQRSKTLLVRRSNSNDGSSNRRNFRKVFRGSRINHRRNWQIELYERFCERQLRMKPSDNSMWYRHLSGFQREWLKWGTAVTFTLMAGQLLLKGSL
jgi:hypothetical protein